MSTENIGGQASSTSFSCRAPSTNGRTALALMDSGERRHRAGPSGTASSHSQRPQPAATASGHSQRPQPAATASGHSQRAGRRHPMWMGRFRGRRRRCARRDACAVGRLDLPLRWGFLRWVPGRTLWSTSPGRDDAHHRGRLGVWATGTPGERCRLRSWVARLGQRAWTLATVSEL